MNSLTIPAWAQKVHANQTTDQEESKAEIVDALSEDYSDNEVAKVDEDEEVDIDE